MISNNKIKGIIYIILASLSFATMNLFAKLALECSPYQKTFISNAVATIIISIIILKRKDSFLGKRENRKYLLLRGVMGTISILTLYYSIESLLLADATILTKLSPFFTIIFSFFILKERITKKQLIFLLLAFIGSLFVIKPQFNAAIIPALMGVISAVSAGVAYTMIRVLGDKESFFTVILSFTGIATITMSPWIFVNTSALTLTNITFLILGGLSFTLGQIFLTLAYKNAPASEISMFDYIGLLFAAVYGFVLFKEIPDYLSLIGYGIIIVVSIINIYFSKSSE
ncbi:DMT family transporter [Clostridium senegalense]|uniref:DMT family transporter n=1 Tax=Clostridium senegalense TaxID=1465809 RepID=A0A6M0H3H5_9CLOT|nr:DMT family transporter [Clostridium senegalense]NEU04182.1 DMT family transporter [Clostridium senegalense]